MERGLLGNHGGAEPGKTRKHVNLENRRINQRSNKILKPHGTRPEMNPSPCSKNMHSAPSRTIKAARSKTRLPPSLIIPSGSIPQFFDLGRSLLHNASQTPPSRVGKVDLHALTCWDPRMSFSASIDSTLGQAHMLHASETPPISLALALPLRHSDWMQSISGHTSIILEGIHAFALDTQPGKIGQPASFKSSYGPHHTKGYPCLENSTTIGHSVTDHSTVLLGNFQNDAHQDSDHCDCYLSIAKTSYNG